MTSQRWWDLPINHVQRINVKRRDLQGYFPVTYNKKKKKSHSTTQHDKVTTKLQETAKIAEVKEKEKDKVAALRGEREGSGSISPRAAPPPESGMRMTEAERRYYEKQKQRREERAKKAAPTTHKDRITELNNKLERIPDHNDMPKIGPG
ncbi:hypothetical protein TREMEDRAFT_66152 [Tremella mesenterica DSM 1558]|uniref:uncharacterized protein n=1 Tax=Tremella mesenterica (strain ATCC 24925 / CBS 8224 / DSM 1558 / NBRC 9311 / NRRL Y-6157 / RJB 2259-6 / UBC 559-6) TaxID=578456 RepID=UPI00032BCAD4|nr:uncharacterized protein TREMEDRAFT_66152 [Tremella mesenterica DSM 1558]EIW65780.1 hypothetical protein TREMEDRAFT_66152 [Tremella mesenterica DSM 1558]